MEYERSKTNFQVLKSKEPTFSLGEDTSVLSQPSNMMSPARYKQVRAAILEIDRVQVDRTFKEKLKLHSFKTIQDHFGAQKDAIFAKLRAAVGKDYAKAHEDESWVLEVLCNRDPEQKKINQQIFDIVNKF